jgi:hypothetical protein
MNRRGKYSGINIREAHCSLGRVLGEPHDTTNERTT